MPLVILAWGALSCADSPESRGWAGSVTDSAGITIVSNDGAAAGVPAWTTETEVVIGEVHGADEYTFGEIADVAVDGAGRFLVLDRQARRARVYGPDGRYLHDVAGPGEGPGELSDAAVQIAAGPHDSIYILDYRQLRLNVYGPDGSAARTIPLRHDRPGPYAFHLLDRGALLIRWFTYKIDGEGRFVPWDVLLRLDSSATGFDTLMSLDYGTPELGTTEMLRQPLIINTAFHDMLADGRIAWSALGSEQVGVHEPRGALALIVRNTSWSRHPTTSGERQALEDRYRAERDDPDAPLPDHLSFPDSLPAITALRAGRDGGFWVQRMGALSETSAALPVYPLYAYWLGGRTWEVYGPDGRLRATLRLPPRVRVTRVLDSAVVGVQRDELDVERVVRLRVER